MEKVKKRMFLWLFTILFSLVSGLYIDIYLTRIWIPIYIRLLGLIGIFISWRLLRVSGKILKKLGNPSEWGWTTKLVSSEIYECLRHPHHFGIGLFVTSTAILIGGVFTLIFMTLSIWILDIMFLILVEEKELIQKFDGEYLEYRKNTPMLIPHLKCLYRELFKKTL